jgi:N-acetyl-anhydromuramyl-L-alanine amidase AmpD
VATAYIVDRNGDIAQMFDPARSAYHLGLRDTQANDLRSIAIEIVNWGPLVARDGEFWAWPGNFAQTKVPKDSVFDNRLQYRGHRFWHSYTPEQIEAVAELTKQLLSQFEIPNTLHATLEFQPASWRNSFQGIASHHNFRADKFDTGPAFPFTNFQKLISTP